MISDAADELVPATETRATEHHTAKSVKMDPDPDDGGSDDDASRSSTQNRKEMKLDMPHANASQRLHLTEMILQNVHQANLTSAVFRSGNGFCPKFDGSTPLSIFLTQMNTCAVYNGWSDNDMLAHMRLPVRDITAQLLSTQADIPTFSKLVERITTRFETDGKSSLFEAQLRARRRGPTETLQSLYQDISRPMALANPGLESTHSDAVAVDAYVDAIDDEKFWNYA